MKKGDIVVCIDNSDRERYITKGKQYEILDKGLVPERGNARTYITILDNFGDKRDLLSTRFKIIPEWREEKLNELGIV